MAGLHISRAPLVEAYERDKFASFPKTLRSTSMISIFLMEEMIHYHTTDLHRRYLSNNRVPSTNEYVYIEIRLTIIKKMIDPSLLVMALCSAMSKVRQLNGEVETPSQACWLVVVVISHAYHFFCKDTSCRLFKGAKLCRRAYDTLHVADETSLALCIFDWYVG